MLTRNDHTVDNMDNSIIHIDIGMDDLRHTSIDTTPTLCEAEMLATGCTYFSGFDFAACHPARDHVVSQYFLKHLLVLRLEQVGDDAGGERGEGLVGGGEHGEGALAGEGVDEVGGLEGGDGGAGRLHGRGLLEAR